MPRSDDALSGPNAQSGMTLSWFRVGSGSSPIPRRERFRLNSSMEQNTTTSAEQTASQESAQDLVRPVEGRVVAGVAQGLANRYDLPVWVPRVVFAITAFFGGFGFALYLGGWALIRSEDESESIAERFFKGATGSRAWIGIGLIFVAALILLDNLTFFSGGVIWAVALLVVGVLLYSGALPIPSGSTDDSEGSEAQPKEGVQPMTTTETRVPGTKAITGDSPSGGTTPPTPPPPPTPAAPTPPPAPVKPKEKSILGRLTIGFMLLGVGILAVLDNIDGVPVYPEPRHYLALAVTILGIGLLVGTLAGRARWLILVGVVLVPTLMFSPVFEWDWSSDTFDVVVEPGTFEDIYTLDVGDMEIDYRELPWDGETVELTASVDVGNLEIWIPSTVDIVGEATVDVGRVGAPGRESAGLGSPVIRFDESGSERGTVLLDAHVDLGNIDIRRGN